MHAPIGGALVVTQLFASTIADKPFDMPYGSGTVRVLGHTGVDISCPIGTPVLAAWAGTVRTGWDDSGFGNFVVVTAGDGRTMLYGHLESFSVHTGASVSAGQEVGRSGTTGHSTGPHVHVEYKPANPDVYNGFRGCQDWIAGLDHPYVPLLDLHLV